MRTASQIKNLINIYAKKRIPFFFCVDFELNNGLFLMHPFKSKDIFFNFNKTKNYTPICIDFSKKQIYLKKYPITYKEFLTKFQYVRNQQLDGNSFLTNLTVITPIECNLSLEKIFHISKAKYKIYVKNKFLCFSPETFVRINKLGKISTYPIKGTIHNNIPNAKDILKNNNKEIYEHYTIVDLLRNDLNKIAKNIKVEYFRKFEKIRTNQGELWQTKSKISGKLPKDYHLYLGDLIWELLPAGSISGAPKNETIKIIQNAENYTRGYYTGISGIFNGYELDTSVMIRFIEQENNNLYFKSGGGITIYSNPEEEYKEFINKIYLPI